MDEDLRKLIESSAAETRRHFGVVAERLEARIEAVAEGVMAANERIDVRMHEQFKDVGSMIRFSHHDLERRLHILEEAVPSPKHASSGRNLRRTEMALRGLAAVSPDQSTAEPCESYGRR